MQSAKTFLRMVPLFIRIPPARG